MARLTWPRILGVLRAVFLELMGQSLAQAAFELLGGLGGEIELPRPEGGGRFLVIVGMQGDACEGILAAGRGG